MRYCADDTVLHSHSVQRAAVVKRHSAASYHSGVASDTVPPVMVTAAPVLMLSDDPPLNTCQQKHKHSHYHINIIIITNKKYTKTSR